MAINFPRIDPNDSDVLTKLRANNAGILVGEIIDFDSEHPAPDPTSPHYLQVMKDHTLSCLLLTLNGRPDAILDHSVLTFNPDAQTFISRVSKVSTALRERLLEADKRLALQGHRHPGIGIESDAQARRALWVVEKSVRTTLLNWLALIFVNEVVLRDPFHERSVESAYQHLENERTLMNGLLLSVEIYTDTPIRMDK